MKRIKNHYVISLRFDGLGHGFAIGFDSYYSAKLFAIYCLCGFADIITEAELEYRYPAYFHQLVSHTY